MMQPNGPDIMPPLRQSASRRRGGRAFRRGCAGTSHKAYLPMRIVEDDAEREEKLLADVAGGVDVGEGALVRKGERDAGLFEAVSTDLEPGDRAGARLHQAADTPALCRLCLSSTQEPVTPDGGRMKRDGIGG